MNWLYCLSMDFLSSHIQDGDTALLVAARKGRTEIISLLLEAGASTDLQDKVNTAQIDLRMSCGI